MNDRIEQAAKEIEKFYVEDLGEGSRVSAVAAIISRHLSSVNEWVKVTPETMPPEGVEVEGCEGLYRQYAKWYPATADEIGCWSGVFGNREDPNYFTHWRTLTPLPAPPSTQSGEEK